MPFSFSDNELAELIQLAQPLAPSQRGPYLEAVALVVSEQAERGDGLTFRIARELQSRFMHAAPDIRHTARSRR